jgi:tetratricopeptide (TPR) repeat protein
MMIGQVGRQGFWRSRVHRPVEAQRNTPSRPALPRVAAFAGAAGLLVLYALRGGSYDVVARQEAGIAIWWVLALGLGLGLLPRARLPGVALAPFVALTLLAGWIALGFAWTGSDERTLLELARVVAYAGLFLLVLAVLTRVTWRMAAGGIAAAALGVCALALASRLFPEAFPANFVQRAYDTNRLNYPFHYWNAVGAWAAMSTGMGLVWSAHARLLVTRIATVGTVPVAAVVAYLTYSRAAAAGMALALLLGLALSRNRWTLAAHALAAAGGSALAIAVVRDHHAIAQATGGAGAGALVAALAAGAALCACAVAVTWKLEADRRWRLAPRPARVGLAVAALALALGLAFTGPGLARRAWDNFRTPVAVHSTDPAARLTNLNGGRYQQWAAALDAFRAEPLHGTGPGTYEFTWARDRRYDGFVRDAHSIYLESLAEMGWPGLLLVLLFLGSALWAGLRTRLRARASRDAGAAAALLVAFLLFLFHAGVDWMWESTAVGALALMAIATAIAGGARRRERPAAPAGGARWRRLAPRAAIVAGGLLAIALQLPSTVAVSQVRRSQHAADAHRFERAIQHADDAIAAEPWAATPYLQRALVLESAGQLGAARTAILQAAGREPTNWRHQAILARIEAELGHPKAALAAFARARRLHPRLLLGEG